MNRESASLPNAEPIVLAPGRVDLWYTSCDRIDDGLRDSYWQLLSPEETERARRYHFDRDRHLYLAAHAMVRTVLARYAAVDPCRWEFTTEQNGKPLIAAPRESGPSLKFNLSHTRGMAVCAVARDDEVGVDIENLARQPNLVGLAERFFAPSEAANVKALSGDRRHARFFEYWTLKESYIKAIGLGLAMPLDQFAFKLSEGEPPQITFEAGVDDRAADWQFAQFQIGDAYQGALAIRGSSRPLTVAATEIVPLATAGALRLLPAQKVRRWTL